MIAGMRSGKMLMQAQMMLRNIKNLGYSYVVTRNKLNEYNELTGEVEQVVIVDGLFHLSKSYIKQNTQNGGTVRAKGQPMLMIPYEQSEHIQNGDCIGIGEKQYKITDKNNIEEYNIVVDLSLELVLDGNI